MKYNYAVILMAMAFMVPKPSVGAEVGCSFDSNSELPWLSTRVCQSQERPVIFNDEGTPYCTDSRADKDGDGWGWENDHSCIIDPNLPKRGSDVATQVVIQEDLVVFEQDFETSNVGPYLPEVLNEQWDTPIWHLGLNEGRVQVVQDAEKGKAIEVLFPANEFGGGGATAFLNDLAFGVGFERSFEELYVSYDVKFADDFEFVRGGKLPGLCGYNNTQSPTDGCNTGGGFPTGYDGWSARGMWREEGILENYMYHADQFYQYGDDEVWGVKAQPGTWHRIQHRVVMNTVGEANGLVEAWFDGVKVLSSNTMLYRKTADIGINLFYFSTFYGGADPSWAPNSDQYIYFDNFRIATTPLDDAEVVVAQKAPVTDTKITEATTVQTPVTAAATDAADELVDEADNVHKITTESNNARELVVESVSAPELDVESDVVEAPVVESDTVPELVVESISTPELVVESDIIATPAVESDSVPEPVSVVKIEKVQEPIVNSGTVQDLAVDADSLDELVVDSNDSQELSIAGNTVQNQVTSPADTQEPELGAANESESGGGVFFAWWLGLALVLRRKLARR